MGNHKKAQSWLVANFAAVGRKARNLYFDGVDIANHEGTYASVWPGAEPNTVIVTIWNTDPPQHTTYPAWDGFGPEPHERPGFPNSYRIPDDKVAFLADYRQRMGIPATVNDQELWDTMCSYGVRGEPTDEDWAHDEIKAELCK